MSKLLPQDCAVSATSVGSFVVNRRAARFEAWASDGTPPEPMNEAGEMPADAEQATLRIQATAYAQGYEEGRRAVEIELAGERVALHQLMETLAVLKPEPTNALALLLAETVDRMVREVVGEVEIDGTLLIARARTAARLIGENTEPSKLRVHPDDVALLSEAGIGLAVEGDAALPRGTVRLETGHGWIEDGPQVRLERLRAELDRMGAAK